VCDMSFQEGQAGAAMPRPTHPYLWTQEGWVYLAVVIDLYSRRVVGWSMDRRMKKALVIRALLMAINLRQPPWPAASFGPWQPVC